MPLLPDSLSIDASMGLLLRLDLAGGDTSGGELGTEHEADDTIELLLCDAIVLPIAESAELNIESLEVLAVLGVLLGRPIVDVGSLTPLWLTPLALRPSESLLLADVTSLSRLSLMLEVDELTCGAFLWASAGLVLVLMLVLMFLLLLLLLLLVVVVLALQLFLALVSSLGVCWNFSLRSFSTRLSRNLSDKISLVTFSISFDCRLTFSNSLTVSRRLIESNKRWPAPSLASISRKSDNCSSFMTMSFLSKRSMSFGINSPELMAASEISVVLVESLIVELGGECDDLATARLGLLVAWAPVTMDSCSFKAGLELYDVESELIDELDDEE